MSALQHNNAHPTVLVYSIFPHVPKVKKNAFLQPFSNDLYHNGVFIEIALFRKSARGLCRCYYLLLLLFLNVQYCNIFNSFDARIFTGRLCIMSKL